MSSYGRGSGATSACAMRASRGRDCKGSWQTATGSKSAISPTRDVAPDRSRHQHSGLRAPRRFAVPRARHALHFGAGRGRGVVGHSLALPARIPRHHGPSAHLQSADPALRRDQSGRRVAGGAFGRSARRVRSALEHLARGLERRADRGPARARRARRRPLRSAWRTRILVGRPRFQPLCGAQRDQSAVALSSARPCCNTVWKSASHRHFGDADRLPRRSNLDCFFTVFAGHR